MKDPHDQNEYKQLDTDTAEQKDDARRLSGAYWYVDTDAEKLAERAFIRTFFTAIAFMLELGVLLLPQLGLEYVTKNIPEYAFTYMLLVFGMVIVSVWLFIMNAVRYKFVKRIPKERAPKNGFKRRAYFGNELYIAVNAVLTVIELSFVCIKYDGFGLLAFFMCLAATACAVLAREFTRRTLKSATLVPGEE